MSTETSKYDGHTPGLWQAFQMRNIRTWYVGTADASIAKVIAGELARKHAKPPWEVKANANLLADAPTLLRQRDELLAKLKRLLDLHDDAVWPDDERVVRAIEAARTAIANATA